MEEILPFEGMLGTGAFSTVWRSCTSTGRVVAVKTVHGTANATSREVKICRRLSAANHANIVEFLGVFYNRDEHGVEKMNLVMELVPTTLRKILSTLSNRDC